MISFPGFLSVLYLSESKFARIMPSTMACAAAALRSFSRARNATLFTWRDFRVRTAAPGKPSQLGRSEFVFLPCPEDQQALRGQPLRVIQQGGFQHLAGQLARTRPASSARLP